MSLSIDSIPELAEMPRRERWRVLGGCHLCSFLHWQTWAGIFLAVAMAIVGQIALRYTFPTLTTRQAPLFGCSGAVVFWLIGSHISWKIRVSVVRTLIRKRFPYLCPDCGYDRRGSGGMCPECGHGMHLRTAEPLQSAA